MHKDKYSPIWTTLWQGGIYILTYDTHVSSLRLTMITKIYNISTSRTSGVVALYSIVNIAPCHATNKKLLRLAIVVCYIRLNYGTKKSRAPAGRASLGYASALLTRHAAGRARHAQRALPKHEARIDRDARFRNKGCAPPRSRKATSAIFLPAFAMLCDWLLHAISE
jgi:hypothetical protein